MAKTKLGSASRYGARYGTPLKKRVAKIEEVQKTPQECPKCHRKSLIRKGYAIWYCRKCKAKIAGGAYQPRTSLGNLAEKIVEKGEKVEFKEIDEKEQEEPKKEKKAKKEKK